MCIWTYEESFQEKDFPLQKHRFVMMIMYNPFLHISLPQKAMRSVVSLLLSNNLDKKGRFVSMDHGYDDDGTRLSLNNAKVLQLWLSNSYNIPRPRKKSHTGK